MIIAENNEKNELTLLWNFQACICTDKHSSPA